MEAFRSLLNVLDALPERIPDETPLADVIPSVWPTVGDLRQLIREADHQSQPNPPS